MIDADVTCGWGAVHTPGLKDPHPIQRGQGDHTQEIDDHPAGGENPHLPPQTGGQNWGQDPRAGAGILTIQAVAPLPEDSHLNIINNPTHQNTSIKSVHTCQTPGEDINWIRSSIWAKFEITVQHEIGDELNNPDS